MPLRPRAAAASPASTYAMANSPLSEDLPRHSTLTGM